MPSPSIYNKTTSDLYSFHELTKSSENTSRLRSDLTGKSRESGKGDLNGLSTRKSSPKIGLSTSRQNGAIANQMPSRPPNPPSFFQQVKVLFAETKTLFDDSKYALDNFQQWFGYAHESFKESNKLKKETFAYLEMSSRCLQTALDAAQKSTEKLQKAVAFFKGQGNFLEEKKSHLDKFISYSKALLDHLQILLKQKESFSGHVIDVLHSAYGFPREEIKLTAKEIEFFRQMHDSLQEITGNLEKMKGGIHSCDPNPPTSSAGNPHSPLSPVFSVSSSSATLFSTGIGSSSATLYSPTRSVFSKENETESLWGTRGRKGPSAETDSASSSRSARLIRELKSFVKSKKSDESQSSLLTQEKINKSTFLQKLAIKKYRKIFD